MNALEYGQRLQREQLHLEEIGISALSAMYMNSKLDPKKGRKVQPKDFFNFAPSEQEVEIPSRVADCFFELVADQLIPGWSLGVVPVEPMRKAKKGNPVSRPRAWVGEGVLLLMPQLAGGVVLCALAAVEGGVSGAVQVSDIDSGTAFLIDVPTDESYWALNDEFNLINP